jgi:cyclic pyranopterin phosphate synthase
VFGADGASSRMIDVGSKPVTARSAIARARVVFPPGVLARVLAGHGAKGALAEVARSAGILAAKRTGELIPMCHPLGLDHVAIDIESTADDTLEVRCTASCRGRTGVEMEALTGATVAALTVYDMTKGLDHGIVIERIELLEKRGGRSGVWRSAERAPRRAPVKPRRKSSPREPDD